MRCLLKLNPVSGGTVIGETFQRLFGSGSQARVATRIVLRTEKCLHPVILFHDAHYSTYILHSHSRYHNLLIVLVL